MLRRRISGVVDPIVLGFLLAAAATAVGLGTASPGDAGNQETAAVQQTEGRSATATGLARLED